MLRSPSSGSRGPLLWTKNFETCRWASTTRPKVSCRIDPAGFVGLILSFLMFQARAVWNAWRERSFVGQDVRSSFFLQTCEAKTYSCGSKPGAPRSPVIWCLFLSTSGQGPPSLTHCHIGSFSRFLPPFRPFRPFLRHMWVVGRGSRGGSVVSPTPGRSTGRSLVPHSHA